MVCGGHFLWQKYLYVDTRNSRKARQKGVRNIAHCYLLAHSQSLTKKKLHLYHSQSLVQSNFFFSSSGQKGPNGLAIATEKKSKNVFGFGFFSRIRLQNCMGGRNMGKLGWSNNQLLSHKWANDFRGVILLESSTLANLQKIIIYKFCDLYFFFKNLCKHLKKKNSSKKTITMFVAIR